MEAAKSSLNEVMADAIGKEITMNGKTYRIVGDDRHSESYRKEWDYCLLDVDTGEMKKVLLEEISDSSK